MAEQVVPTGVKDLREEDRLAFVAGHPDVVPYKTAEQHIQDPTQLTTRLSGLRLVRAVCTCADSLQSLGSVHYISHFLKVFHDPDVAGNRYVSYLNENLLAIGSMLLPHFASAGVREISGGLVFDRLRATSTQSRLDWVQTFVLCLMLEVRACFVFQDEVISTTSVDTNPCIHKVAFAVMSDGDLVPVTKMSSQIGELDFQLTMPAPPPALPERMPIVSPVKITDTVISIHGGADPDQGSLPPQFNFAGGVFRHTTHARVQPPQAQVDPTREQQLQAQLDKAIEERDRLQKENKWLHDAIDARILADASVRQQLELQVKLLHDHVQKLTFDYNVLVEDHNGLRLVIMNVMEGTNYMMKGLADSALQMPADAKKKQQLDRTLPATQQIAELLNRQKIFSALTSSRVPIQPPAPQVPAATTAAGVAPAAAPVPPTTTSIPVQGSAPKAAQTAAGEQGSQSQPKRGAKISGGAGQQKQRTAAASQKPSTSNMLNCGGANCNEQFPDEDQVFDHRRLVHHSDGSFAFCTYLGCKFSCIDPDDLGDHTATHGGAPQEATAQQTGGGDDDDDFAAGPGGAAGKRRAPKSVAGPAAKKSKQGQKGSTGSAPGKQTKFTNKDPAEKTAKQIALKSTAGRKTKNVAAKVQPVAATSSAVPEQSEEAETFTPFGLEDHARRYCAANSIDFEELKITFPEQAIDLPDGQVCPVCDEVIKARFDHQYRHTQKFFCPFCIRPMAFPAKNNLKRHVRMSCNPARDEFGSKVDQTDFEVIEKRQLQKQDEFIAAHVKFVIEQAIDKRKKEQVKKEAPPPRRGARKHSTESTEEVQAGPSDEAIRVENPLQAEAMAQLKPGATLLLAGQMAKFVQEVQKQDEESDFKQLVQSAIGAVVEKTTELNVLTAEEAEKLKAQILSMGTEEQRERFKKLLEDIPIDLTEEQVKTAEDVLTPSNE